MSAGDVVMLAQAASTTAMVGLIWFVQVVHYPLFGSVGREAFVGYEAQHTRRTTLVVGPLMAVEGVTALMLAVWPPDGVPLALPLVGLGLLAMVHASTVLLQVPDHRALGAGFDRDRWRHLVATNWIRTVGWSARGVVSFWILTVATA